MEVLIFVYIMILPVAAITTDIVVQNITASVLRLNVTGSNGNARQTTGLYNDNSTWYDARLKCLQRGHTKLGDRPAYFFRWRALAQTMRENNVNVNLTFWTGIYRPFVNSPSWYGLRDGYGSRCKDYTNYVDLTGMSDDERCLSGRFVDLYQEPVLTADVCTNSHAYICFTWYSDVTIYVYDGFVMEEVPTSVELEDIANVTSEFECAAECERAFKAIGFIYNFTDSSCILYKLEEYSNELIHEIVRTNDNVTHGVKLGITSNYSTDETPSILTPENYTIPECPKVDTIPRNYCLCETQHITDEALQTIVDELVRNLTIDKKTTSKNKQKYSSSKDERNYSIITGSIAVCLITVVLAIPVISDALLCREKMKMNKKRKRRKRASSSNTLVDGETG